MAGRAPAARNICRIMTQEKSKLRRSSIRVAVRYAAPTELMTLVAGWLQRFRA